VADVSRRPVPFWLRPRWLVGHVLVVALVATFVSLGLWQLRRHDDRRERNAEIAARAEVPTAPVEEVVPPGAGIDDVEALRFRRVVLVGTYDTGGEVLIRPRSQDGVSGWDVVTPLVLRDGRAVLVDRGFAPLAPSRRRPGPPPCPPRDRSR
jgi:cytochrome oxidase assembly protein ShyY1